ncbi:SMP-30/gluconolactonase/LRE family protein [Leptospira ilyithenensis]|uniref:SMP-30/gluconolaconase/LRE-like region n=1 Tax=Leptospira ilyithenensis TaxID=2484901 RepID=A0A4R9LP57_9LEPT|nr:SMP-30/gluconolactonase/LRE family protein [Leptospira ilyithenensis]TGN07951.1 SMP-30/gluconolaconase/LRE-like region [Leptospira ilyithenensis]
MKMLKIVFYITVLSAFTYCSTGNVKVGDKYLLGDVPKEISSVESKNDPFLTKLQVDMKELVGHDDLIFDSDLQLGYASGMDGWIWKLDFQKGIAEKWVKPPVNPAGMSYSGAAKDKILFCASRLGGESYSEKDRVGLYEVEIKTKIIQALVTNLPKTDKQEFEKVYLSEERKTIRQNQLDSSNSRPFSLCNDLAVSKDGKRIYITEPFEREDASMGSGAVPEAIGLYPHGKLWLYDREKDSISLVLNGFTFIDGILLEEGKAGEESVIFTETTKFRILRADISGNNKGKVQVLFENLPGLADGLERDEKGRIWVGIIKPRSGLVNFVHRNPWIKSFLLSLPQKLLPIAKKTGILVLDRTGERALYYVMHDGTKIRDISVAVPYGKKAYFPVFDKTSRGLYSVPLETFLLGD